MTDSARITTTKALLSFFETLDASVLPPLMTEDFVHEFRPYTVGSALPPLLDKKSTIDFVAGFGKVMKSFPFTAKEIIESEKENKVVVWCSSKVIWKDEVLEGDEGLSAEEGGQLGNGWEYEGEYVLILEFEEGTGRIRRFVEFMDSYATLEKALKLLGRAGGNMAKKLGQ
ncbi:hypothetical protein BJY04DRAFT_218069 [Aspergillus karnatakaensis]|uniref:nuclear transport factor 2 family protein n=1 Tax=Aspergillus karnatakaensis TaxID=1810916 RepID=UPI003CCD89EE